jgi:hypothetical protein
MKFELHITIPRGFAEKARKYGEKYGWTGSNITDDPVIGPGPKFYLTRYITDDIRNAFSALEHMSSVLFQHDIRVIREKIELIMHDRRYE